MEINKKEEYEKAKQEQYVPIQVPQTGLVFSDHIAPSAEPDFCTTPYSQTAAVKADEIYEFRLNIPEDDIIPEKVISADKGFYYSVLGTVTNVAYKIWGGIEVFSTGVSDFLGITSPRYEMYIEDSIKYNEEMSLNPTAKEFENAAILKAIINIFTSTLRNSCVALYPTKMLKIPFKQAEPIAFHRPLKVWIQQEYEEDPETYAEDFDLLESLRLSIQDPQVHDSSAATHLAYYAQLNFLESKFDISEDQVKLFFTWANAFGTQDCASSHNIGFEKASVLFNLGAIYNQLGITAGVGSEEALKKAAQYFQQAAGVYQSIVDKLPSWNIPGSANVQLNSLSNLMLAQAQEVFLTKAIGTKMKAGTLAKLAMQTACFYGLALDIAQETSVFDKAWLSHLTAKQNHFSAVAQYYKGLESEANGKYGEQISWLAASKESSKKALDKNVIKHLQSSFENDIKSFSSMVDIALQRANNDNDKIYMEVIPKELEPIPPARMVNPILVPEPSSIAVSRPIFRNLVPLKIHQAASAYEYKKDTYIKGLCSKLNEATVLAHTTLASQKLPGAIEALEQPIGLPSVVLERSTEVRGKGPRYIENSWSTLCAFATSCQNLLDEALLELDNEEKSDEELRRLYGPQWNRTSSSTLTKKLREKGQEYRDKILAANQSNGIIKKKIDNSLYLIEHLCMDKKELEASIPSSTASSTLALNDPNLKILKSNLNELNKNIKQRAEIVANLKKTSENDEIGARLTANALSPQPLEGEALFAEQLKVYASDASRVKLLIDEQEKLLATIYSSNQAFMNSRQTNQMISERETALSNLDTAYKHFKDISSNLEEGIKFFNDIEGILKKFHENCIGFTKARSIDKQQLLAQIQSPPSQSMGNYTVPPSSTLPAPGVWNAPPYQQQPYAAMYYPQNYQNTPPSQHTYPPGQYQQPMGAYGNQGMQQPPFGQMPQPQQPFQQTGGQNSNQPPQFPHHQLPGNWYRPPS